MGQERRYCITIVEFTEGGFLLVAGDDQDGVPMRAVSSLQEAAAHAFKMVEAHFTPDVTDDMDDTIELPRVLERGNVLRPTVFEKMRRALKG